MFVVILMMPRLAMRCEVDSLEQAATPAVTDINTPQVSGKINKYMRTCQQSVTIIIVQVGLSISITLS